MRTKAPVISYLPKILRCVDPTSQVFERIGLAELFHLVDLKIQDVEETLFKIFLRCGKLRIIKIRCSCLVNFNLVSVKVDIILRLI